MIKKVFVFPQYYIAKVPYCDNCNVELQATGYATLHQELGNVLEYKCPMCTKVYNINSNDLNGEWKWRTI